MSTSISTIIRNGISLQLPESLTLAEIKECDPDVIPLLLALYGHLAPLKELVKDGLDLTTALNTDSDNLFLLACYGHHRDIIDYLVHEQHMNPKYCNIYGENGLLFACNKKHKASLEFIKYLINLGVNLYQTTIDDLNIFHVLPNTQEPCLITEFILNLD